ncbi:acetyl/propionyl/methylcrotonyl-CoA carboxylase subunit alpha [Ponticaulis sp.]|uniref:acetyl/propionyl/methylcrotonyl-CoA carboxylase subunit alpha n=1 Tax=Ponticaulis sp. TaxID=2020902 RepID=UPI000C668722|nr:acetyl/propionyl/methylcrotonyl-CoA carboxylase subunit alpha [Ponticaulis sp.]MAF58985.1 methylcrotonoyl-CoA carboxylase [Ponticaulis sp.]MBN06171.1 methylcrotonoyl-CoA carboxylase [Ponticaulis sp.]
MISSILIANRGEIACRVIRTARELGIRTIAVFSDADANALHALEADEAVHIGPAPANESYLIGSKIIEAAKQTGADAIHPGYGFLSENAAFAQSVIDAGIIWVGPKPDSINAMGLKDAAKKLMQDAGVPTTPGYLGEDQSSDTLKSEADKIGYPVLIKAVAGGGGKGMRKVERSEDFLEALGSCQREAKSSFGDDRVLLEKFITNPRHIEVQVFGDTHGNVVHLFERDCTLQRRHQKVIEEAPAPGMSHEAREAICAAAVRAAQAVNYVGAGTVEFIADGSGPLSADRTWFMEMNTRLQVEHPVTEEITGIDLVEWQLRVAAGEALPLQQDEIEMDGWAMEARLYAENPETGFLPSTGKLEILDLPSFVRVDTGVYQGSEVSPFYDPMIAKLIAYGETRDDAREALASACGAVATWPVRNNAGFLTTLLREPAFAEAEVTTGFIEAEGARLTDKPAPSPEGISVVALHLEQEIAPVSFSGTTLNPWSQLEGFRLNAAQDVESWFSVDGEIVSVTRSEDEDYFEDNLLGTPEGYLLIENGWPYHITWPQFDAQGAAGASDGAIISPMPGKVIGLFVSEGQSVTAGEKLVTLEAMKMEHNLTARHDGIVATVSVAQNDQVEEGAALVTIEPKTDEA